VGLGLGWRETIFIFSLTYFIFLHSVILDTNEYDRISSAKFWSLWILTIFWCAERTFSSRRWTPGRSSVYIQGPLKLTTCHFHSCANIKIVCLHTFGDVMVITQITFEQTKRFFLILITTQGFNTISNNTLIVPHVLYTWVTKKKPRMTGETLKSQ